MKKLTLFLTIFAFLANVSAQFKVNSSGNILIGGSASNFLGTTASNIPVIFKVNGVVAGYTGASVNNDNVYFGYMSASVGSAAMANTAIGYQSLCKNSNGCANVAVGYQVLHNSTYGFVNTAQGYKALYNNTSGSANTAIGHTALYNNNGGCNTTIGYAALYNNTTGNCNTTIGYQADVNAPDLSNATAIGYNAKATASNTIMLGNSTVTHINVYGATIYQTSDGRTKRNIRSEVPGLTFINQLQPVMYNFDLDALDELQKSDDPKINAFNDSVRNARSPEEKAIEAKSRADKEAIVYSGFIAQDVEKAAKSVDYDFNGVYAPKNGKGAYGLGYAEFVVPLVKAVQELSEQNNRLQEQVNELLRLYGKENAPERVVSGLPQTTASGASLEQNIPNPFSQNTQIKFYIPETVKSAQLCIYNLQGLQLRQIFITQRGAGSEIISGSQFAAGIYLYALIADGKEVDVKRMILTDLGG